MNLLNYQQVVNMVIEAMDYVMVNEMGIYPPEQYVLDAVGERVALAASFNPMQMGRSLKVYESEETARHLSAAIGGLPVVITHSQGLRYVIPLSGRPQLPKMAELPNAMKSGQVYLGVKHTGRVIMRPWHRLGHIMAAGITRSGKSVFLRLLAFQALRDGFQLAIADNDRSTFPMLKEHAALFMPIAADPTAAAELIEKVMAECDARAAAFEAAGVDTLEEYRDRSLGLPRFDPMLVILDELSNTILSSGTKRKQFTNMLGALGMRALKFGIHVVFAAHEFTKEQIGLIRPQCETVICFRNEAKEMCASLNCAGAERIGEGHQGMAVTNKWGKMQMFYLDKSRLSFDGAQDSQVLPKDEEERVLKALNETDGRMSIPQLVKWGMDEWNARGLLEEYERRGWLEKRADMKNARYVTPKLADLVLKPQTAQTASNTQIWSQSGSNRTQTADMAGA